MVDAFRLGLAVGAVAVAVVASWTLPVRWRAHAIVAGGAGVLAVLSWPSLLCLSAMTAATWLTGRLQRGRLAATLAVGGAIAAFYLFILWRSGTGEAFGPLRIIVPLGMGYYVLRLLHYAIEMERGGFRAHSLLEYACYQFLPATLPVGPIHRFDDFLRDLRRRRWDPQLVAAGASRILTGLAVVVVVGAYLLPIKIAPVLYALTNSWTPAVRYVDTLTFWLNIYVQFSGYSSVAIGVGALMGFTLPENFNRPFLARNIGDFWRRWHMTLSAWCRDYVYTPTLAVWRTPAIAGIASMLVLGLWHEVSLHYVIWGLYHGLGLAVWRRFSAAYDLIEPRLPPAARRGWALTAHILTLNFVMFSYPTANAIEALVMRR